MLWNWALKVLHSQVHSLSHLGDDSRTLADVIEQATAFMLACYGQSQCSSMTEARLKVWTSKVGRSIAGAPKLATLPPTNGAFGENVARAHLQVAIWRHALDSDPLSLQPTSYGWKQEHSNSLMPTTVPEGALLAPVQLLKLIRCSCESDTPCKTRRCGCSSGNLACTVFCSCQGNKECFNVHTKQAELELDDEDDTD